jgi:hypothetical protein
MQESTFSSQEPIVAEVRPDPAPDQEQYLRDLHMFAAQQMHQGAPEQEVYAKLVQHGLTAQLAQSIVGNVFAAKYAAIAANRSMGKKNMLYGALWCVGGLAVTIATFAFAAKNGGGGGYVVFWGAVIFGAIQFFRGLAQWLSKS